MSVLVQFAGVGIAALGAAYVAMPRKLYRFGFDSLRDARPEPSEPSDITVWLYRFIGVCLVLVGAMYLS